MFEKLKALYLVIIVSLLLASCRILDPMDEVFILLAIITVMTIITAIKTKINNNREELERISQLYRFAEFGRLTSGIFHDLMNYLTAISLNIEKLNEHEKLNGEIKGSIEKAMVSSKRMESFMQTVRNQLKFYETQSLFEIEKEINSVINLISYKANSLGIQIKVENKDNIKTYGNSIKFSQIVINLLCNALDSYKNTEDSREKTVILKIKKIDDKKFGLSVTDYGKGIKEDDRNKIFKPFFTTKSKYGGMGLGLSITKHMVTKDFGGKISFESSINNGSTFRIEIPIKQN